MSALYATNNLSIFVRCIPLGVAGPTLWNELPRDVGTVATITVFNSRPTTYSILQQYLDTCVLIHKLSLFNAEMTVYPFEVILVYSSIITSYITVLANVMVFSHESLGCWCPACKHPTER